MRARISVALSAWLVVAACQGGETPASSVSAPTAAPATLHLPDGEAGRVVARAIAAAGGWEEWQRHRDAAFISTLTIFDAIGNTTSETIFLHELPLHDGLKTRLESIGLDEEVTFGFDGRDAWMLRGGRALTDPPSTAFTHFHALSSLYWFSLPFVLAETPGELSYLGPATDGGKHLERVRVAYKDVVATPVDWLVLFIDADSGRIDHVHCHVTAEFLRQTFWVGEWREYRDYDGIKKERRHSFFPADVSGTIVGGMAAEQLVEHVRFDNGFPREWFTKPPAAGGGTASGGSPAGDRPPQHRGGDAPSAATLRTAQRSSGNIEMRKRAHPNGMSVRVSGSVGGATGGSGMGPLTPSMRVHVGMRRPSARS